ncbi:MAG TPA: efflux RND transporter periplasmic adaptor subunit [Xanthobacteraceae bacterium]|nr:efflux RND transporter periplasmic adaptor subunit [Xanthobacteraceae bacterium]
MSTMRVVFRLAIAASLLFLAACRNGDTAMQGWIEADLVFIGPDEQGRVETLSVREGDKIEKGAPVSTVDDDLQQADLHAAEAALANAKQAFTRAETLLKNKTGTRATFDQTQAAMQQAESALRSARTRLARRKLVSPVSGTVQQVYYRPGELVPAGRPVISLLPPGNIKVRFYVPETILPQISYGEEVNVNCDGCAAGLKAKVSFISKSSEYTPPVIYSQDERSKLVFLIEARPEQPDALRVGQPVSVALAPKAKSEAAK